MPRAGSLPALAELHAWRIEPALREGRMMEVLGEEIAVAWDFYRRQVGEDTARSGRHFQDAVNERLFRGRRIL